MEIELSSFDTPSDTLLEAVALKMHPSKIWKTKQFIVEHRCTILLVVLVILLSLGLVLSVGTLIFINTTDADNNDNNSNNTTNSVECNSQPGPSLHQQDSVAVTREYQVLLNVTADWQNRTAGVLKYLHTMSKVSSLHLDVADVIDYVHDEFEVHNICHFDSQDYFRIRHYFQPANLEYNTTIGIKKNDKHSFSDSYAEPFWPADKLFPRSFQKCERDMHVCWNKYSRETIYSFPEYRQFEVCGDLAAIYPWAGNIKSTQLLEDVPQDKLFFWWLGKNTGYLNENTKYEIEFTLRYSSLKNAMSTDSTPAYGEWSIRIFAMDDGLHPSHKFDEAGVAEAEAIWKAMVAITDVDQCLD